jgi:hypothetical protein
LHHFGRWASVKNIGAPAGDENPVLNTDTEEAAFPQQRRSTDENEKKGRSL